MNAYLVLFLICFVPLATHRYNARTESSTSFFSKPQESPAPSPSASPSTPVPSPSLLSRIFSYLIRRPSQRIPLQKPPPASSEDTHFASPPVVRVTHRPSPVSRWFSTSAPTRARRAAPPPKQTYYRRAPLSSYAAARNAEGVITLTAFLGTEGSNVDVDMVLLMAHIQAACKHIGAVLSSPKELTSSASAYESVVGGRERDDPRSLRIISNNILQMALRSSGKVAAISSEEDDAPIWFGDGPYVVVFDPLDGSQDFDELTPTGTVFSIYYRLREADHLPLGQKAAINVMQRGERLVAAGYGIYSSATMMCFSVGTGLHGFTLDSEVGEFVLTHPDIRIPERGNVYSVNDGRYFDWPAGLRQYVDTIRQGRGQNARLYSAKYISSIVADLHRTILYGGITMNPRSHLHLIHEANALSFLVENGGGRAIDGSRRILEIQPTHLHQRLSLFLGSRADVSELEMYGDVQQEINIRREYDEYEDEYY